MLGKLRQVRVLAAITIVLACATCSKNVPQDKSTGNDGKVKGAKTIILENGEGKTRGIVTYPGGDRVDWKMIELPKDKVGTMGLRLSWTPPRPGLSLGVDVFDEYGRQIASVKGGKKKSLRRSRKAEVSPAKGKYFIRVYAVNRGDAGKYTLTVTFAEQVVDIFDIKSLEIPDPPKLPAVPEPEVPCDEFTFDKKNPACRGICPNPPDPGWPACQGRCPVPPDANNPSCWATMPCPNPPDRRIKACPKTAFPKCNPDMLDPQNPNCDNYRPEPVRGQVINVQVAGDGAIITINRGMERGVQQGWKGKILKKGSTKGMEGGDFTIVKAGKRDSVAKVRLTTDQVQANPDVLLEAP
jgi:hypothetical protein